MKNYVDQIKEAIERITGKTCRITATGELECVCPKCGGSRSKTNKRQFYMSLKEEEHPFICFRCGFKGKITNLINFLLQHGIKIEYQNFQKAHFHEDKEEGHDLSLFYRLNYYRRKQLEKYEEDKILDYVFCENCRYYIFERIYGKGRDVAEQTLIRKNLFEDFNRFIATTVLCCQNVKRLTKNKYKNHVGICSYTGGLLQLRTMVKNSMIRYISIKTHPFNFFDYVSLTIGNPFENKIVVLAEGFFTLLRGFLYLLSKDYFDKNSFLLISTFGKTNLFKELKRFNSLKSPVVALLDQDVSINPKLFPKIKFLKPVSKLKDFGEIDLTNYSKQFLEVKENGSEESFVGNYGRFF